MPSWDEALRVLLAVLGFRPLALWVLGLLGFKFGFAGFGVSGLQIQYGKGL